MAFPGIKIALNALRALRFSVCNNEQVVGSNCCNVCTELDILEAVQKKLLEASSLSL